MIVNYAEPGEGDDAARTVVSLLVNGHTFGVDIGRVEDVFVIQNVTPVPLAPHAVVGILNLRGKVITAICMRGILGFPEGPPQKRTLAIGVSRGAEIYGFLIDAVGDVQQLKQADAEPVSSHVRERWARYALAVHKLPSGLLVELDVDALIRLEPETIAA
jgi:purine-binding chemotaxis protein CheW